MNKSSFFANTAAITMEEVANRAPSVFATEPHEGCSARYEFIDTRRVIGYLEEEGYKVASAQAGTRGRSRSHGMHTVRMRAPFDNRMPGDLFPEIVFTNSHDKTSRAILDLGIYRTACANGLVVGAGAGLSFTIPHVGKQRDAVLNAAARAMEFVPRLVDVVEAWNERMLTDDEVREFNRRASAIKPGRVVEDLCVVGSRRNEDSRRSLWNIFNRAQENILRGGVPYRTESGRLSRTRALGSVKKSLEVNQKMWSLAEEFLPA